MMMVQLRQDLRFSVRMGGLSLDPPSGFRERR